MCAAVAEDTDRDVRAVMTENMGSGAWARHGAAKLTENMGSGAWPRPFFLKKVLV